MTIKTSITEPIAKYWTVFISEPGKPYHAMCSLGVVSVDMQKALQKVKDVYPDSIIVNATHKGAVDILDNEET